jgi:hypothetical protein
VAGAGDGPAGTEIPPDQLAVELDLPGRGREGAVVEAEFHQAVRPCRNRPGVSERHRPDRTRGEPVLGSCLGPEDPTASLAPRRPPGDLSHLLPRHPEGGIGARLPEGARRDRRRTGRGRRARSARRACHEDRCHDRAEYRDRDRAGREPPPIARPDRDSPPILHALIIVSAP